MTGTQKWIWTHYTVENRDTVKCNHNCEEVFSRHQTQLLQYHLYSKHEITELDGHPERDNILQNYKISELTLAACNHCKKTINLVISSVFDLITHLKIDHPEKCSLTYISTRRTSVRNKYDVTGNNARSTPTSPRSISGNDFHRNKTQIQSGVRTNILTRSLKRKKEETKKNDRSTLTSPRSISGNDFHGNKTQIQSGIGTNILTRSLKRKKEETKKISDGSYSSSKSNDDLREALIESKIETKVYNLRKKRTNVVDGNALSTSRSTADEDGMQSQSRLLIRQRSLKKKQ